MEEILRRLLAGAGQLVDGVRIIGDNDPVPEGFNFVNTFEAVGGGKVRVAVKVDDGDVATALRVVLNLI